MSLRAPIVCFLLLISPLGLAEQLQFDRQSQDGHTQFKYRWKDNHDTVHQLSFVYDNKTLFNLFRNFKGYQVKMAKHHILMQLHKAAARVDSKKVRIRFIEHSDSIEYRVSGSDDALVEQTQTFLKQVYDKAESDFLAKHYYNKLTDKFGRVGVKPDHVKIADQSVAAMQPIAAAILKTYPQLRLRQMLELVLSFVQSIPYSTLENRRVSNGAGFSPPLKLLYNNQGDCDSKVTFMAALLHALYPRLQMAIVYLPEHALLGLHLGHRSDDKYLEMEGRDFLLVEPTGPAMLGLGEIAEQSAFFVNGQQFDYELF